jgi:hypothetical protein
MTKKTVRHSHQIILDGVPQKDDDLTAVFQNEISHTHEFNVRGHAHAVELGPATVKVDKQI